MAESRSHKTTANRIAKKMNTEYNDGKGVDIKSRNATIEVELQKPWPMPWDSYEVIVARLILPVRIKKPSIKL